MAAELSSTPAPDQARSGPTLRFKLVIAYDGTRYQGWQTQQTGVGIQQKIEEALAKIFPGAPRVYGSSRTDTGVHALGLVAHVDIAKREDKRLEKVVLEVVADAEHAAQRAARAVGFVPVSDLSAYVRYYGGKPHDVILLEVPVHAPAFTEPDEPAAHMF